MTIARSTGRMGAASRLPSLSIPIVLAACQASSAVAAGPDASEINLALRTPVIHVEQTIVMLKDGVPLVEAGYRHSLETCKPGPWQTEPLPADAVAKLGRTYLDIWYDGPRMATHSVTWNVTMAPDGPPCRFRLVRESELQSIVQPGWAVTIDLVAKKALRSPSRGVVREPVPDETPEDAKLRAAVAAELAKKGMGSAIGQTLGAGTGAGQPCVRRYDQTDGEFCMWTGGGKWGFTPDGKVSAAYGSDDAVLLWSKPPAKGAAFKWETRSMTIGGRADERAFAMPTGISVRQAN